VKNNKLIQLPEINYYIHTYTIHSNLFKKMPNNIKLFKKTYTDKINIYIKIYIN